MHDITTFLLHQAVALLSCADALMTGARCILHCWRYPDMAFICCCMHNIRLQTTTVKTAANALQSQCLQCVSCLNPTAVTQAPMLMKAVQQMSSQLVCSALPAATQRTSHLREALLTRYPALTPARW
jgi:uncharacterized protein with beta-barrel porin domain